MFSPQVGATYVLRYVADNGSLTSRTVRVMEVGDGYFRAFCFMRMEPRTFTVGQVTASTLLPSDVSDAMWNAALTAPEKPVWVPATVARVPAAWKAA